MSEAVVTFAIVVACALAIVPPLAIFVGTRSEEARRARGLVRDHAGVRGRVGAVLLALVRAAVFDRSPEGRGRATIHVWTLGSRGPTTVLVVFEREGGEWVQTEVLLRPWIPFARPQKLPS